jgi:hypothetical protein
MSVETARLAEKTRLIEAWYSFYLLVNEVFLRDSLTLSIRGSRWKTPGVLRGAPAD